MTMQETFIDADELSTQHINTEKFHDEAARALGIPRDDVQLMVRWNQDLTPNGIYLSVPEHVDTKVAVAALKGLGLKEDETDHAEHTRLQQEHKQRTTEALLQRIEQLEADVAGLKERR